MTITWTPEKLKKLKDLYNKSVKDNKESFLFEGKEIVTGYARYLIMYLDDQFK